VTVEMLLAMAPRADLSVSSSCVEGTGPESVSLRSSDDRTPPDPLHTHAPSFAATGGLSNRCQPYDSSEMPYGVIHGLAGST
jgi:hypothetical protein